MKVAILEEIEHLVVREAPDLQLEEGAVVIEVKVCSICGTDLRIYRHGDARVKLPHVLGHEIAGEVKAVDEQVTDYKVGDRVAVTPRISCGECFYCRRGQPIFCQNGRTFGYQLPGGYAEYLLVSSRGVQFGVLNRIADTLSFEEAALSEPLSCCIRAQRALQVRGGDTVVVIGGGPVGMMHCRLAKANGASKVILVERETKRLKQVDLSSIDEVVDSSKSDPEAEILTFTQGRRADVVIVTCSSVQALEQSLSLAGRGGRINIFAGLAPG